MAVNWQPTWQLLVAFNNAVFDDLTAITTVASPAGTLGAKNVWTDVSPYLTSVKTKRGRQHEVDRFECGTLDAVLRNTDGRFDSWNTSSPYNGLILPGRPVRLQATINGTTYPVWTGYADVWSSQWPDEVTALVELSCVDAFQTFTNAYVVSPLYPTQVVSDGAVAYWRLNEPAGSTVPADSSGHNVPATISSQGTVVFGQPGAFVVTNDTSASLQTVGGNGSGTYSLINVPDNFVSSSAPGISVEYWMNSTAPSDAAADAFINYQIGATQTAVELQATTTGTLLRFSGFNMVSTVTGLFDGKWHHLVATVSAAGVCTLYVDGVSVGSNSTSPLAYNFPGSFVYGYDTSTTGVRMQEVALYPSVLTAAQVANHHSLGAAPPAESSGARLGRIATWVGWPTNPRNIDSGSSQVQAVTVSLTGTTVLAYLQLVELSENGALFMDRSGNLRFIARQNLLLPPYTVSQKTFGDGGGSQIPFEPVPEIARDTLDLYTQAFIQRQNGIIQTYEDTAAAASYGPRTYQPNQLLVTSDLEAAEYARWEVTHLSQPITRIRRILVHPLTDPTGGTASAAVLARELMDRITVARATLPGGGTGFSQASLIEGVAHQVDFQSGDWTVIYALAPADTQPYWIWGTSEWDTTPPGTSVPTRWAY